MTDNIDNSIAREELISRLYRELSAQDATSPDFKTTLDMIHRLESEKDSELIELEKLKLQAQINREEVETAKLQSEAVRIQMDTWVAEQEATKPEKKESFFSRHGDAIITAGAGIAGVVVVVAAESLGNKILNSKAMKMPTIKF